MLSCMMLLDHATSRPTPPTSSDLIPACAYCRVAAYYLVLQGNESSCTLDRANLCEKVCLAILLGPILNYVTYQSHVISPLVLDRRVTHTSSLRNPLSYYRPVVSVDGLNHDTQQSIDMRQKLNYPDVLAILVIGCHREIMIDSKF